MTPRLWALYTVAVLGLCTAQVAQGQLITVEPGLYNLQIAFREDGALLDAWMITR